jgi:t-SNARE complex subunit (syntaxin)
MTTHVLVEAARKRAEQAEAEAARLRALRENELAAARYVVVVVIVVVVVVVCFSCGRPHMLPFVIVIVFNKPSNSCKPKPKDKR